MDGDDPTGHVMTQACSFAGTHPVTLCLQTGYYSRSFCIKYNVLVAHDTIRSVFLYTSVV